MSGDGFAATAALPEGVVAISAHWAADRTFLHEGADHPPPPFFPRSWRAKTSSREVCSLADGASTLYSL
jgi:hypothetical protein